MGTNGRLCCEKSAWQRAKGSKGDKTHKEEVWCAVQCTGGVEVDGFGGGEDMRLGIWRQGYTTPLPASQYPSPYVKANAIVEPVSRQVDRGRNNDRQGMFLEGQ